MLLFLLSSPISLALKMSQVEMSKPSQIWSNNKSLQNKKNQYFFHNMKPPHP